MSVRSGAPFGDVGNMFVTAASEAMKEGQSNVATLGFSFAFTFIGEIIFNRNTKSKIGRKIARILGVDVDAKDLSVELQKIKNHDYFQKIEEKMQNVLRTGNIQDLASFLELSEDEAWNIFLKMESVVLGRNLHDKIAKITNSVENYDEFFNKLKQLEQFFGHIPEKLAEIKNDTVKILQYLKIQDDKIAELKEMLHSRLQNDTDTSTLLSTAEHFTLAYMMTDPQATVRGVWLYPLHQQLTYRGFTETEVGIILSKLMKKNLIKKVDVETYDMLEKRQSTAPAYKITDIGIDYIHKNLTSLPKLKEIYTYIIRLFGSKKSNEKFLHDVQNINFVQAQTRFIIEDDKKLCRIKIFAYKPVDNDDIMKIAKKHKTKIHSFYEEW